MIKADSYFPGCHSKLEIKIVDVALNYITPTISANIKYSKTKFQLLREQVKKDFDVPITYITPVMERLLYALSSIKKPQNMLLLGIYCGNTLIWNVGSSCGSGKVYNSKKVLAVDIDDKAILLAKRNFENIKNVNHISFITDDALNICKSLEETIDYLYLDVKDEISGKAIYYSIIKELFDKLSPNAWILAHDTVHEGGGFPEQLKDYLKFVRNPKFFKESYSFPIDDYGLELSIKK